jgi:thioredoxin
MNKNVFFNKIKNNPRPIVVDLWAPWCGPCRAMEPAFKDAGTKFTGKVDVVKVNADDSPEVMKELGVLAIPTVISFAGGKEIMRRTGMQPPAALDMIFEAALNQRKPDVIPPAPIDRLFRTVAGLALLAMGWWFGNLWFLYAVGAVVLFSGYYDRCPIFKMLAPRVAGIFRRPGKAAN